MATSRYSTIVIIYNPNSTSGLAETRARRLKTRLAKRGFKNAQLIATKYSGHAEALAYEIVSNEKHPLLVSVSGDGGYNELINGALRAANETGHKPVCCILAAGNANDHRRSVKKMPLNRAIAQSQPETMDLLKITITAGAQTTVRYAHSYIGFGFTSHAVAELNEARLTRLKELAIVARTFFNFQPTLITIPDGRTRKIDSLVFTNVHRMAKVMRVGKKTELHDGRFRMVLFPHQTRLKFVFTLLKTAILGVRKPVQARAFECSLPRTDLVHLDGEVQTIPGGAHVRIEAAPGAVLTVR